MVRGRTLIHALIGAIVGVVLSFIPFSTVIGGAVAGFLEGPDSQNGAAVGALAGAITFVPVAGVALLVLAVLGLGAGATAVPLEGVALAIVLIAMVSMTVLLYTVGLSLLGGYLGASLAREYPEQHARTRRSISGERRDRYEPIGRDRARRPNSRAAPREPRDSWRTRDRSDRERRTPSADRPHRDLRERIDRDRERARDDQTDRRDHDRSDREQDARDDGEPTDASDRDTFSPDPHDRLDPTRWHENREDAAHDRDRSRERQIDPELEGEREPEPERDE